MMNKIYTPFFVLALSSSVLLAPVYGSANPSKGEQNNTGIDYDYWMDKVLNSFSYVSFSYGVPPSTTVSKGSSKENKDPKNLANKGMSGRKTAYQEMEEK